MKWLVQFILIIWMLPAVCQPFIEFENKFSLENFYCSHQNLSLYLKILQNKNSVIISGSDTSRKFIHILIFNKLTKKCEIKYEKIKVFIARSLN